MALIWWNFDLTMFELTIKFTQGSHFFPLMKFPDFSSISVIFPSLFSPRLENANYIYLWLQMRLLFQAKTAWRQLKYIKILCLPPIFTDNEHVFHNVELILNKTMSGNNCF